MSSCDAAVMKGVVPPCDYCDALFCLSHLQPEVHGCGDAAKGAAKMKASADIREQKQTQRAAVNAEAQRKMDAKRAELAQQRAKAKPKK